MDSQRQAVEESLNVETGQSRPHHWPIRTMKLYGNYMGWEGRVVTTIPGAYWTVLKVDAVDEAATDDWWSTLTLQPVKPCSVEAHGQVFTLPRGVLS